MPTTPCASEPTTADWAEQEFGQAQLPDRRHVQRLKAIATSFAQHPTASIPQACGGWAQAKGAYRFFENEEIDPEAIAQAHERATLARVRQHPIVLAIQDTTALNYSTHPKTKGLGALGSHSSKVIGLHLHSTLAVTVGGTPLGWLHRSVRRRTKARGVAATRHRRPTAEKESVKWLDSLSACQQVASQCPQTMLVNIADREGDLYDFLAQAVGETQGPRVHVLVRSRHNRKLTGSTVRLWEKVRQQPVAGTLQVRVGRKGEQPARRAEVSVRFATVTLAAPLRKTQQAPLEVRAIEVREARPPKGVQPLLWQLVTTLPITCFEEAAQQVEWYAMRWQIEVMHKVLKSGCGIEQRQLETAERLQRVLAVDQVVAWRLLALCKASREVPNELASHWLSQDEWEALWCHVHRVKTPPITPPTVREAVRWIAQLGGFLARRSDGEPGPIVLWRGMRRLSDLTSMWQILRPTSKR